MTTFSIDQRRHSDASFSRVTDGARCCYYSLYVCASLATISSLAVGVHFLGNIFATVVYSTLTAKFFLFYIRMVKIFYYISYQVDILMEQHSVHSLPIWILILYVSYLKIISNFYDSQALVVKMNLRFWQVGRSFQLIYDESNTKSALNTLAI